MIWRSQQNKHRAGKQSVRLARPPKGSGWPVTLFPGAGSPKNLIVQRDDGSWSIGWDDGAASPFPKPTDSLEAVSCTGGGERHYVHWPPDPETRSPAAANGRANRNSKASASLGTQSYTNGPKFSTLFGRSSIFPNDALGREAKRSFESGWSPSVLSSGKNSTAPSADDLSRIVGTGRWPLA